MSASVALAQGDVISEDATVIDAGKQLFDANCKTCHRIHEKNVGPALQDVYNRAPSVEWIREFVRNPTRVIQSGDQYANDLFNEYNIMMTAFPLEDEQIMSILAYVQDETKKGPAEVAVADTGTEAATQDAGPSGFMNAIMVGIVILLLLVLGILFLIMRVLKRYLQQQSEDLGEEDKELLGQTFSLSGTLTSKPVVFLTIFIITALVVKGVITGLFSIGVQMNYAPTQPIAYSHKLHAGQYQIDCNYCHTGVRKSRNANIPSANICMNCHSSILPDSPEIKKIKAAVDNDTPIEWIRIHNMPDLAYFSHAQHVEVGGVECQTCHGQIQEMDVVKQENLLTMGWCVDCHRKTEVNGKDNAYYDQLIEYHKGNGNEKMTVEDIGGLECAKCHY